VGGEEKLRRKAKGENLKLEGERVPIGRIPFHPSSFIIHPLTEGLLGF
jgi:hypothetical protein